MKYVITGSLGNISKPLAQLLVKAGHDVTIITSKEDKTAAIEAMGAKAAVGSVEDADFLTQTFTGADAVYTMVPPNISTGDWKGFIRAIGKNYADAIKASGVKKVVNLSSIGAHMPEGCGPVSGLYFVEQDLNNLPDADVKHLRPAYFYTNLFGNIGMIKHMDIIGGNYGDNTSFPMVHPNDIAIIAAEELLQPNFTGKSIRYIAGDERTTNDIAKALGEAIGKPDLAWVNFSNEQALGGIESAGVPHDAAANMVEMGDALRSGAMGEDYYKNRPALSETKLEDFAREFAPVYAGA